MLYNIYEIGFSLVLTAVFKQNVQLLEEVSFDCVFSYNRYKLEPPLMTVLETLKTTWPWLIGVAIILWALFLVFKVNRRDASLKQIDNNNKLSLKLELINNELQDIDQIIKNFERWNGTEKNDSITNALLHLNNLANVLLQLKDINIVTSISDVKILIDHINSDIQLSIPANSIISNQLPKLLLAIRSEIAAIEKPV